MMHKTEKIHNQRQSATKNVCNKAIKKLAGDAEVQT